VSHGVGLRTFWASFPFLLVRLLSIAPESPRGFLHRARLPVSPPPPRAGAINRAAPSPLAVRTRAGGEVPRARGEASRAPRRPCVADRPASRFLLAVGPRSRAAPSHRDLRRR